MHRLLRRALAPLCLLPLAACDSGTESRPPLEVRLQAGMTAPSVEVGQGGVALVRCDLTLGATATGPQDRSATWLDATFHFYAGANRAAPVDSFTVSAAEMRQAWGSPSLLPGTPLTSRWTVRAGVPFAIGGRLRYQDGETDRVGTATFEPVACGGTIPPGGVAAPTVTGITVGPAGGEVEAGQVLTVTYTAGAAAGLWETVVTVSGAFSAERRAQEQFQPSQVRTVQIPVPTTAVLGQRVVVTVQAVDAALQASAAAPVQGPLVVDRTAPELSASLRGMNYLGTPEGLAGSYATGDVLSLWLRVQDNHALGSLVYEIGDPVVARDSVRLTGPFFQEERRIPIPAGWEGDLPVRVRARDAAGNPAGEMVSAPGAVTVHGVRTRPVRTASTPEHAWDAVLDASRGRLFLSIPDRREVAVLSLASMSFGTPIALPAVPGEMDLTRGGDSLVVALPQERAVAVVDLSRPAAAPAVFAITAAANGIVWSVRVAANGKALVVAGTPEGYTIVVELDPGTGAQRLREDAEEIRQPAPYVRMGRTLDRSRVMVSAVCNWLYTASTDRFGPCRPSAGAYPVSGDAAGRRYAQGPEVLDANLSLLHRFPSFDLALTGTSGISPDGETVYASSARGLFRARATDGAVLERIVLPPVYGRILFTPDGTSLIAIHNESDQLPHRTEVRVVDLR